MDWRGLDTQSHSRPWQRVAWPLVVLLALLLHAPSLGGGFMADDFGIQLVLDGRVESSTWKPWNLYDFGALADAPSGAVEQGAFPWWTSADWRLRFLRPLTSLSLWLDHGLFGASALAGHAVSMLLFAALLWAAHAVYLRLGLSPVAALLALTVQACDTGSLMPVGWIANRNSLLEGLFALLAVRAGLEAVQRASAGAAAASFILAALSVASKESGVHVFLLLAWMFWRARERAPWMARAAAALVVCAGVYLIGYALAGYGSNAIFYPLPWCAPQNFAERALTLAACAPLSVVSPFTADLVVLRPDLHVPIVLCALLFGGAVVCCIARRLRGDPRALLLLLWGTLALLPQAGTPPSDRLMFTPMIPWSALLALYLTQLWSARTRGEVGRPERAMGGAILVGASLLSSVALLMGGVALSSGADTLRRAVSEAEVAAEEPGARDAFLLQASPSALMALSPGAAWVAQGGREDVRFHPLQSGQRSMAWIRTGPKSFALETRDGQFLNNVFESVFLTRALRPNESIFVARSAYELRGTADDRGALLRIELELPSPLEDLRWRFLVYEDGRLQHRPPPAIGETIVVGPGFRNPLLP